MNQNLKIEAALSALFDALNVLGGSSDREATVRNFFSQQHRTLQQHFVRVIIIPILVQLAEDYSRGYCDGRNMSAGQLAKKMLADLTDDDLYLPLI